MLIADTPWTSHLFFPSWIEISLMVLGRRVVGILIHTPDPHTTVICRRMHHNKLCIRIWADARASASVRLRALMGTLWCHLNDHKIYIQHRQLGQTENRWIILPVRDRTHSFEWCHISERVLPPQWKAHIHYDEKALTFQRTTPCYSKLRSRKQVVHILSVHAVQSAV